jgi:hypothetical protein
LTPTWHEAHTAGRVRRHTDIIRELARELSTAADRIDRPSSAAEARTRWDALLARLAAAPRSGLAAATGNFIDGLIRRSARYVDHLFHCFDDIRILANTNTLERFFGKLKQALRHSVGCGSTTNTVLANLGDEPLLAYTQLQRPGQTPGAVTTTASVDDFHRERQRICNAEAPGIRRRSMVRHLDRHLDRLRDGWLPRREAHAEGNA